MVKDQKCGLENFDASSFPVHQASSHVSPGGELHLSNVGQLSLLRGIAERGATLRTTVRGFSMSPFILDQDVLTIAPINSRESLLGQVVAFIQFHSGRLAIHRVIKETEAGWLVKGDNCPETDGAVEPDKIIGRIVAVERNGHRVRLTIGPAGALIAALNRGNGLMRLKRLWSGPHRAAGFAARRLQGLSLYRKVGRRLASSVEIVEASQYDLETVHLHFNPYQPHFSPIRNPNVTNWVARTCKKVIGFVQLVYHSEAHFPWVGHWLFSLHVWALYRGLGIGENLTRHLIRHAENQGLEELLLVVFEDNHRAIRLYRKLGFAHISLSPLEPALEAEKQRLGRRRIVMRKRLIGEEEPDNG